MTTSISSLFQAGLFRKYNFVVSQLRQLTPKTTVSGFPKCGLPFFHLQNWRWYFSRFQLIKKQQKCLISPSNFYDPRKVDHILERLEVQSFFNALYVIYQLSEIKDDIQVVSQFPCLLQTTCCRLWNVKMIFHLFECRLAQTEFWQLRIYIYSENGRFDFLFYNRNSIYIL